MLMYEKEIMLKIHDLFEHEKEKFLRELSFIDKETLACLRELMCNYYSAKSTLEDKINNADLTFDLRLKEYETSLQGLNDEYEQKFADVVAKYIRDEQELRLNSLVDEYQAEIDNKKAEMLSEIEMTAQIVQTTGDSETAVMSQKAVSDNLYIASLIRGDLSSSHDLNSIIQHGVYGFSSSSIPSNVPFTGNGGTLVVHKGNLNKTKPLYTIQIIYSLAGIYYRIGSSKGFSEWERLDNNPTNVNLCKKKNILFTEFEKTACWWDVNGGCSAYPEYNHSQLIPVNGGATYYVGNKTSNDEDCVGAFFNANGEWVAPLITGDLTEYVYNYPDGTGHYPSGNITYAKIYQFTAPANACYFSYNLRITNSVKYKQFISSKPIIALSDSGNYAFDDDFPAYQATKDKNLCVIGASTVMIDRLYREVETDKWEHIVGFQEYLVPWYKSVESYGFTSGSWRKNDGAENLSIYNGIITNAVDLSGYDEFLLRHSNSGFTINKLGDAFTTDTDTYIGGFKAIIDYIYSVSPTAKIYVSGIPLDEEYYTSTSRKTLVDTAIAHLKTLCAIKGCHYIDTTNSNHYNKDLLTFDGKHNNHEGSKREGLFYRKIMVGI